MRYSLVYMEVALIFVGLFTFVIINAALFTFSVFKMKQYYDETERTPAKLALYIIINPVFLYVIAAIAILIFSAITGTEVPTVLPY